MEAPLIEALIALVALTLMEIVLGIDNIVFIAVLVGRLPEKQRALARRLGLGAAMVMRILLLLLLWQILALTAPVFTLTGMGIPESWLALLAEEFHEINEVSYRDLILLGGGLFLVGKAVHEIHESLEGHEDKRKVGKAAGFVSVLVQIAIMDIIFSLDSVITAIGMVDKEYLWVMIVAIMLAVGVMLVFAATVSRFVDKHPTLKMLALSFLILIGVMLVAESVGTPVNKGYIYFAMTFSLIVEFLNLKVRNRTKVADGAQNGAT